ncbi:MAG: hypothetical protein II900_07955 [Prevotella sp.]|nr:hypothetical protein [Prevotella sp.]
MNRIIVVFLMLVTVCTSVCAQRNKRYFAPKDMYMFGVCFSAIDSTVYFTDIKQVPNTSVERGSGFLYSRNNYSYQLQQYFKSTSGSNYTAVTCYNQKRTKLEKKYAKMRQKYQKKHFVVNYVHDFAYNPITYSELDEVDLPAEEAKKPESPKGPRPGGNGGR